MVCSPSVAPQPRTGRFVVALARRAARFARSCAQGPQPEEVGGRHRRRDVPSAPRCAHAAGEEGDPMECAEQRSNALQRTMTVVATPCVAATPLPQRMPRSWRMRAHGACSLPAREFQGVMCTCRKVKWPKLACGAVASLLGWIDAAPHGCMVGLLPGLVFSVAPSQRSRALSCKRAHSQH